MCTPVKYTWRVKRAAWSALAGAAGVILAIAVAFADEEAAPRPYITTAGEGGLYFRMVPDPVSPDEPQHLSGKGYAYRVGTDQRDELLWTTSGWYAHRVVLSDDGRYLVRLGNWPRGDAPSKDHLAVAFYDQGQLLASYSTIDLIRDPSKVRPSVSHYQFASGSPGFVERYGHQFRLVTVDGAVHLFDVRTGILAGRKTGVKP
jgi:hypothetical protein